MTALPVDPSTGAAVTPAAATSLAVVPDPEPLVPPEIVAAEARWWRGMLLGMAIGIPLSALLWAGLGAVAVGVVAESHWPVWPTVLMSAVIGVFAGAFLGGWAGVTACAEQLDEAEIHTPRRR
jgi:hypothetical protein